MRGKPHESCNHLSSNTIAPRWQKQQRPRVASIETRLFIDGQFVDAVKGGRFATVNPANGETLAADVGRHRRGHRPRRRRRQTRVPRRRLVAHGAAPAHGSDVSLRRADRCRTPSRSRVLETLDMGKPITRRDLDRPALGHRHDPFHGRVHRQDRRHASRIPKRASCTWCCASRSASSARSRRGTTRC